MSVLRTGRGRAGGGGGGGEVGICFFLGGGEKFKFFFHTKFFRGGGGFWGVWGAPRPHPGVARGRKTIHFFLWP